MPQQLEPDWAAVMDFRAQFIEAAQAYAEQEAAGGAAMSGNNVSWNNMNRNSINKNTNASI